MAEIKIKINVDAAPLTELLKKLDLVKGDIKDLGNATPFEKVEEGFDGVSESIDGTTEATKTLKQQLREMTNELQGLEPGTDRFKELSIEAGKLKDTISDTNAVIQATAGSGVENLAKGLAGVAGIGISGFQGIASAQALFGVESEKLQETLVKLQALAGLSDAVKSLGGLGDTLTTIKASFGAVAQAIGLANKAEQAGVIIKGAAAAATGAQATALGAQTVATGAATTASNALNVSLLANPIFLLIGAITAVVGALVYFSEEEETAAEASEKLNDEIERQNFLLDLQSEKATRTGQNRIALLKAQGATEQEIHDQELKNLRIAEDNRIKAIQQAEFDQQDYYQSYKRALREGDEETAKSEKKRYDEAVKKYQQLKNLDGQYVKDYEILNTQFSTDQKKEEEKANEELRKKQQEAYKKRLDDQAKYNQARLDAARKIKDLELSLLEDGEVKEKQLAAEETKRALEDLQKKYGDYNKLNKTLQVEFDKQSELLTIQGENKQKEIRDKYKTQREKDLKEGAEKIAELNIKALEDGRQKEIKVREAQFKKEKEELDKLLEDKKISFADYQDAIETITESGRKDIDKINDKYDDIELEKITKQNDEIIEGRKKRTQEEIEEIKKSLNDAATVFNDFASQTGNEFAAAFGNSLSQISASIDVFSDEASTQAEKALAAFNALSSIASGFISAQTAKIQEELEVQNASIDSANREQQESLQSKLDAGIISQEEFDKQSAELEKKANAQKDVEGKKAFEQSKKLQIAQAVISGLQGAVGAYSSLASIPVAGPALGAAAAIAIAAFTASNIKKINATQYQSTASSAGGGSPSIGGSAPAPAATQAAQPQFNLFGQNNNANTFGAGTNNEPTTQAININSTVSVQEINSVQNTVAVQESRASL